MLAVYRHSLTFTDNFSFGYSPVVLQPATICKRGDLHAADHQVVQQADINQVQRLLNTRSDLTVCLAGFSLPGGNGYGRQ
ncbi:Uncharacterised protein [Escherichia coli]|uniref:Uncharacterized protein n=1 Tax=Escherichia coli TaxID=562 RepID=A0A377E1Y2_ECOLX|nr:Uncharacterised protein [Escherichia coli]